MVHDGIKNWMLSTTICEAWGLLNQCLGLTCDEISNIFTSWNSTGEPKHTYIVQIGSAVCSRKKTVKSYKKKKESRENEQHHLLSEVLDIVVQDDDDTGGTFC